MKDRISEFLGSKIEEGDFPSATYLVAEKGEIVFEDALGLEVVEPEKIEAKISTIYDLASLTKPLVTGLLCATLIEKREINLSDPISSFFEEFDTEEKKEISIKHLLTHTSGFKAWKPFYLVTNHKSQIPNDIASEKLENPIDSSVVYSDLNFLLLGFVVEKIFGKSLDQSFNSEIFEPLGLLQTCFNPPGELKTRIAASEKGNEFEKQTCIELGYLKSSAAADGSDKDGNLPSAFRSQTIWGEVHDNNCYFLDGVAGHAGLFSNVHEVSVLAKQFLPETTKILKPETCKLFRTNFTPRLNQARSLAFQLAETVDSTASEALSNDSFGHLGFTGTSLWIDPDKQRIFILLTNRTHNRRLPFADLKEVRQNFHRISSDSLDSLDSRDREHS